MCVVKCKLFLMMNVFYYLLVYEVLWMWIYVYDEKFMIWNDFIEKKFINLKVMLWWWVFIYIMYGILYILYVYIK